MSKADQLKELFEYEGMEVYEYTITRDRLNLVGVERKKADRLELPDKKVTWELISLYLGSMPIHVLSEKRPTVIQLNHQPMGEFPEYASGLEVTVITYS